MYCSLDDAFVMHESTSKCAKNEKIINDIEHCKPTDMYDTQGEFKNFEEPKEVSFTDNEFPPMKNDKSNHQYDVDSQYFENLANAKDKFVENNTQKEQTFMSQYTHNKDDDIKYFIKKTIEDTLGKSHNFNFNKSIKNGVMVTTVGVCVLLLIDIIIRVCKKL